MKKIVRTVWISLLSGLAFLVACTSPKGLTRSEKKQLKAERTEIINQIDQKRQESLNAADPSVMMAYRDEEYQLRQRLSVINSKLDDRNAQVKNGQVMSELIAEMDSLKAVINSGNEPQPCLYGPPTSPRSELRERIKQLQETIQRRESSCVYGSPEIIQQYGAETRRLRQELDSLQKELNKLENE